MSGYKHCACRDCFEIAIGEDDEPALCSECEEAGCDDSGCSECEAEHAYGYDSTDYESEPLDCFELCAEDE